MRLLVAMALFLGGCVAPAGPNYGTPGPSDGPAFDAAAR
jgi:hypothetical protein